MAFEPVRQRISGALSPGYACEVGPSEAGPTRFSRTDLTALTRPTDISERSRASRRGADFHPLFPQQTNYWVIGGLAASAGLAVGLALLLGRTPFTTRLLRKGVEFRWDRLLQSLPNQPGALEFGRAMQRASIIPSPAWFIEEHRQVALGLRFNWQRAQDALESYRPEMTGEALKGWVERFAQSIDDMSRFGRGRQNALETIARIFRGYHGKETARLFLERESSHLFHEINNPLSSLSGNAQFLSRAAQGRELTPQMAAELVAEMRPDLSRLGNSLTLFVERPGQLGRSLELLRERAVLIGQNVQLGRIEGISLAPDAAYDAGLVLRKEAKQFGRGASILIHGGDGKIHMDITGASTRGNGDLIATICEERGWQRSFVQDGPTLRYTLGLRGDEAKWAEVARVATRPEIEQLRRQIGEPNRRWIERETTRLTKGLQDDWIDVEKVLMEEAAKPTPAITKICGSLEQATLGIKARIDELYRLRRIFTAYHGREIADREGALLIGHAFIHEVRNDLQWLQMVILTWRESQTAGHWQQLAHLMMRLRDTVASYADDLDLPDMVRMLQERGAIDGARVVAEMGELSLSRPEARSLWAIARENYRNAERKVRILRETDPSRPPLEFRLRGDSDELHFVDNAGGIEPGTAPGLEGSGLELNGQLARFHGWDLTRSEVPGGTDFFLKLNRKT